MGRRADEAVERARFAVHEMTNSRVHSRDQLDRCEQNRAQRLRDIGWGSYSDSDNDSDEAVMGR